MPPSHGVACNLSTSLSSNGLLSTPCNALPQGLHIKTYARFFSERVACNLHVTPCYLRAIQVFVRFGQSPVKLLWSLINWYEEMRSNNIVYGSPGLSSRPFLNSRLSDMVTDYLNSKTFHVSSFAYIYNRQKPIGNVLGRVLLFTFLYICLQKLDQVLIPKLSGKVQGQENQTNLHASQRGNRLVPVFFQFAIYICWEKNLFLAMK